MTAKHETEWKQAAGRCGYNVPGPVWGAYCNGTALFVWQHGPNWWTGVVCGHGSTSGDTREEAQDSAKAWALKSDRRDADRRVTKAQFAALIEVKGMSEPRPRNSARDGFTVAELIEVLSVYDKDLPVRFTSCESGGAWPSKGGPSERSRAPMGVFTDEQIAHVDETLCGGKHFLQVSLLKMDKETT